MKQTSQCLTVLSMANFVIGVGAFVVVGILPPLAEDLAVSPALAGSVMTAYALAYALCSPLVVAGTGHVDRRSILACGLALFALGALLAAMAPDMKSLLAARTLMALGAGLVSPVAASVAIALVDPSWRGRALAIVFGGLTLAQVIGVPLGSWIGYTYGWRQAFLMVAIAAAMTMFILVIVLPRSLSSQVVSLSHLARALRRPWLMLAVSFTVAFLGGVYTLYTFLAPLLEARLLLGRDGISSMLLIFGLGAVVGNVLGGSMTDRMGPTRTLFILCCGQMVLLPILTMAPLTIELAALLLLIWSVFGWSFMVPQQVRLVSSAGDLQTVLLALNASAIYIGASLGAFAGAVVLHVADLALLGVTGAVIVLLALLSLSADRYRESAADEPNG